MGYHFTRLAYQRYPNDDIVAIGFLQKGLLEIATGPGPTNDAMHMIGMEDFGGGAVGDLQLTIAQTLSGIHAPTEALLQTGVLVVIVRHQNVHRWFCLLVIV
jgi:hypothetical protein